MCIGMMCVWVCVLAQVGIAFCYHDHACTFQLLLRIASALLGLPSFVVLSKVFCPTHVTRSSSLKVVLLL